jgi:hypothetical protein
MVDGCKVGKCHVYSLIFKKEKPDVHEDFPYGQAAERTP